MQMMRNKHEHVVRPRTIAPAFSERALKDAKNIIAVHARNIGTRPDGAKPGDWM